MRESGTLPDQARTTSTGSAPTATQQSTAVPVRRRRGRRPGGEDTRALILDSARQLFTSQGYDRVSLRAVARAAGVDPALVHHYFGGKSDLFAESVARIALRPSTMLERVENCPPERLGATVVRVFLDVWEDSDATGAFSAILGAAISPGAIGTRPFQEFLVGEIFQRFPLRADDPAEVELRAQLMASQMLGLALTRYVLELPAMARASTEELVALLGPTLQRYATGTLLPGELAGAGGAQQG